LSVVSIASSMLFGAVSGSSMACTAAIGSYSVPEMVSRGYNKSFAIGTVLGGASLDILIPPSVLAVIFASLSEVSLGKLLIAILGPGVMLGVLFIMYVIVRGALDPSLAPPYVPEKVTLSQKIWLLRHILPMALLIFVVIGFIYLGICTASEAAALGAFCAIILSVIYRKFNRTTITKSLLEAGRVTSMIVFILIGSRAYSQLLAYTGAATNLCEAVTHLEVNRWVIIVIMQLIIGLLDVAIDIVSIMYIIIPIYFPIITALGFDPIWFSVVMMINIELCCISPPFGFNLYVMKSISPPGTTMGEVFRASIPYCIMHVFGMILVMLVPEIALWLPSMMK